MVNKEYSEAFVEVLNILEHTETEAVNKIPKKFMDLMKENASKEYKVQLDYTKEIEEMGLKQESLNILALIYRNYWCTPEQKEEFDKKLQENERKYQEELREKYNPDKIFQNNESKDVQEEQTEPQPELLPVEVPKESFYTKLVNFIKRIFKRA